MSQLKLNRLGHLWESNGRGNERQLAWFPLELIKRTERSASKYRQKERKKKLSPAIAGSPLKKCDRYAKLAIRHINREKRGLHSEKDIFFYIQINASTFFFFFNESV